MFDEYFYLVYHNNSHNVHNLQHVKDLVTVTDSLT